MIGISMNCSEGKLRTSESEKLPRTGLLAPLSRNRALRCNGTCVCGQPFLTVIARSVRPCPAPTGAGQRKVQCASSIKGCSGAVSGDEVGGAACDAGGGWGLGAQVAAAAAVECATNWRNADEKSCGEIEKGLG